MPFIDCVHVHENGLDWLCKFYLFSFALHCACTCLPLSTERSKLICFQKCIHSCTTIRFHYSFCLPYIWLTVYQSIWKMDWLFGRIGFPKFTSLRLHHNMTQLLEELRYTRFLIYFLIMKPCFFFLIHFFCPHVHLLGLYFQVYMNTGMHDVEHEYIELHHMFLKITLFELLYTVYSV